VEAAALVDAGATAANAARVALAHARGRVAIAGAGPVGFLLAGLLRRVGLAPLVVEPLPGRRAAAARAGLRTVPSLDEAREEVDVVADCAGDPAVVPWALDRLAARGLLLAVGYARLPGLDFAPLARKELAVRGIRSGSRADLEHVLALAARRELAVPPVRTWPLAQINEAFAALRRGEVEGKAVIVVATEGDRWTS
jgi:2-desacetyl-2-hydroxyethyl bacteriochlorophyllide A dehydrogenase